MHRRRVELRQHAPQQHCNQHATTDILVRVFGGKKCLQQRQPVRKRVMSKVSF